MADINEESDGPAPGSAAAFDYTLLPDFDNDFIDEDDFNEFSQALAAPENSPSAEDVAQPPPEPRTFITALNDWRPIHQRVRRRGGSKKPPRRARDETREGYVYLLLKWPLLTLVFGWLLLLSVLYGLTRYYIYLYEHMVAWRGRRQRLRRKLQKASSYEAWVTAARALDTYLGNDAWKEVDEYAYYDSKTVRRVHDQMARLRASAESAENGLCYSAAQQTDVEELRALVEACLKNNFVGFENPRLYSETYYGTKDLVQEFVDEVEASVSFLLRTPQLDQETKRAIFKTLSTNFGRTALCLSGGATFAYYHFGVAKALLDASLMPDVITGTSGGALVAALLCTRTDEELKKLIVPALAHRITACHDDMLTWIKRWYRTGARFDSVDWAKRCGWFTRGSMTFREAFERTGRILNVSCVPSDPHSPTILANYLTSPDCVIWSAVLASAAVPGILNPVVLMKKTKDGTLAPYSFGHRWKDGSLRTDIPLKTLNLHFNVRFSIVSQVNPHINLFFFSSRGSVGRPVTHRRGRGWRGGFLGSAIEQYIKLDLNKWLKVLRHLELLPRPMGQDWSELWLQRFSGTITIWPKSILSDFYYILSDPTPERMARMIHVGQQSTFPKLKFIANRAKLERLIQQGRRQFRPRGTKDGPLVDMLSEDDLQNILKRTRSGESRGGQQYPLSDSESDSGPESPSNVPGFSTLATKSAKHAPSRLLATDAPGSRNASTPNSPSLGKRLSGWWSAKQPQPHPDHRHASSVSIAELQHGRGVHSPGGASSPLLPLPRTGSFLQELRRQSRVFVDDETDPEDYPADNKSFRRKFGLDGSRGSSDADAGADAEDATEGFGDDERSGKTRGGGGGIGLGLTG